MADAEPGAPVAGADGPPLVPEKRRHAELPVRVGSAAAMLAISGFALWRGGWVLDALIVLVAVATYYEWQRLVRRRRQAGGMAGAAVLAWLLAGAAYVGIAALLLIRMPGVLFVYTLGVTVMTDTGAFFAGRAIGGPKLAPRISPSKTWAGLLGGMVAAAGWSVLALGFVDRMLAALAPAAHGSAIGPIEWLLAALAGAALAAAAQAGDFHESWMKRRAKVKDSSSLIPGHGGVFDRVDGLLPVSILVGLGAWAFTDWSLV